MTANVYLKSYLEPFDPWLSRPDVTDILVNRPGEVWIETAAGAMTRVEAPELTETALTRLARQVASGSSQGVNREQPLLSASLPDGARIQVVGPPATRQGTALAIRKHSVSDLSLASLAAGGMFERPEGRHAVEKTDAELRSLLHQGQTREFLGRAVQLKKTIVVSGGTSSGKTTLLNALVKEVEASERLLVIEDAPEIRLEHPNSLGLLAVRGDLGEARVGVEELLQASLRMRPDRILLGELRGKEAFAFLRAVNTGHPGSLTTVHADSPAGALDQIAMLALLGGVDVSWTSLRDYARQVVDVIVQLGRFEGRRFVSDIMFEGRGLP